MKFQYVEKKKKKKKSTFLQSQINFVYKMLFS